MQRQKSGTRTFIRWALIDYPSSKTSSNPISILQERCRLDYNCNIFIRLVWNQWGVAQQKLQNSFCIVFCSFTGVTFGSWKNHIKRQRYTSICILKLHAFPISFWPARMDTLRAPWCRHAVPHRCHSSVEILQLAWKVAQSADHAQTKCADRPSTTNWI